MSAEVPRIITPLQIRRMSQVLGVMMSQSEVLVIVVLTAIVVFIATRKRRKSG